MYIFDRSHGLQKERNYISVRLLTFIKVMVALFIYCTTVST